ncbi:hypothetical protein L1999_14200 [Neobacillus drentensis]|uniref:hypothetical protein n=1 Tax=Neobacillus drentensis TaxID=220684 RepID=UPI001F1DA38A|nr:hypothetical protein [Neobacillus drentensis]ULT59600.1 hypothetical protein L1999_14200 [Neobacillus drentensis]
MLLKKIDNTVDIITRSLDLAEMKNNNNKVKNLSKFFSEINQLQKDISSLQKEFSKRGLIVSIDLNIKLFNIKIKNLTDLIDHGTIPTEREFIDIKNSLVNSKYKFTENWKEMVRERIKPVINLLTIVKDLFWNDNQAIFIIKKLNNLYSVQPSTKSFDELEDLISQGTGIITNLHLNDTIIEFLQKVFDNKATVSDLSPQVLVWLEENDLKDSLKLSFS